MVERSLDVAGESGQETLMMPATTGMGAVEIKVGELRLAEGPPYAQVRETIRAACCAGPAACEAAISHTRVNQALTDVSFACDKQNCPVQPS